MSGLFPNNKWLYMVYIIAPRPLRHTRPQPLSEYGYHHVPLTSHDTTCLSPGPHWTGGDGNWRRLSQMFEKNLESFTSVDTYTHGHTCIPHTYTHTHTHIHTHHIDRHSCVDIAYLSIHDLSVVIMTNWLIRLTTKPRNQVTRTPRGGYLFASLRPGPPATHDICAPLAASNNQLQANVFFDVSDHLLSAFLWLGRKTFTQTQNFVWPYIGDQQDLPGLRLAIKLMYDIHVDGFFFFFY